LKFNPNMEEPLLAPVPTGASSCIADQNPKEDPLVAKYKQNAG